MHKSGKKSYLATSGHPGKHKMPGGRLMANGKHPKPKRKMRKMHREMKGY